MAKPANAGETPFDEKPPKKTRKKAVRTPLSKIMLIAGQIDRLLNKLPDDERRRAMNVVIAAQTLAITYLAHQEEKTHEKRAQN